MNRNWMVVSKLMHTGQKCAFLLESDITSAPFKYSLALFVGLEPVPDPDPDPDPDPRPTIAPGEALIEVPTAYPRPHSSLQTR